MNRSFLYTTLAITCAYFVANFYAISGFQFWQDEQWRALYYSDPFALSGHFFTIRETPVSLLTATLHYLSSRVINIEQSLLVPNVVAAAGIAFFVSVITRQIYKSALSGLFALVFFLHNPEFFVRSCGLKSGLIDILAQVLLISYVLSQRGKQLGHYFLHLCIVATVVFFLSFFTVFTFAGLGIFLLLRHWSEIRKEWSKFLPVALGAMALNAAYVYGFLFTDVRNPEFYQTPYNSAVGMLMERWSMFFLDSFPEVGNTFLYGLLGSFGTVMFYAGFAVACISMFFFEGGGLLLLTFLSVVITPWALDCFGLYSFNRTNNLNLHILYWTYLISCMGLGFSFSVFVSGVCRVLSRLGFSNISSHKAAPACVAFLLLLLCLPDRVIQSTYTKAPQQNGYGWDNQLLVKNMMEHHQQRVSDHPRFEKQRICFVNLHYMLGWGMEYYMFHYGPNKEFFKKNNVRFYTDKPNDYRQYESGFIESLVENCDVVYRSYYYGIGGERLEQSNQLFNRFYVPRGTIASQSQAALDFFTLKKEYKDYRSKA